MLFIQVDSYATCVILWILSFFEEKVENFTMSKSSVTATIQRTHSRQGSMSVFQIIQVIAATSLIWLVLDVFLFYSSGFMGQDQDSMLQGEDKMPIEKRLNRDRTLKLKDNGLKFIPHAQIKHVKGHLNNKLGDLHKVKSNENIMQQLGDDGDIHEKIESKLLQKELMLKKLRDFKKREPPHQIENLDFKHNADVIAQARPNDIEVDNNENSKGCTDDEVPCKAVENKEDLIVNEDLIGIVNKKEASNQEDNNEVHKQVWH